MQVVVNIPDEDYKKICANKEDAIIAHDTCRRIANWGIPLPKGHGDLIDRSELQPKLHGTKSIIAGLEAPTVIPADEESEK